MAATLRIRPRTGGDVRLSGAPRILRHMVTPVVLAVVLAVLYAWVSSLDLDSIERRSLNSDYIVSRTGEHLLLTVIVTACILAAAIPGGVLLTRPWARRLTAPVLTVANVGQALPSIGLIVLLTVTFTSLGADTIAVIAFMAYGILPVLRNTIVGLRQVDRSVIESARGMGMTRTRVLFAVELPLAVPVMLAGIRTALVITVGTVALATFVGAGGLGDIISNGINSSRDPVLISGSVLVAVLALTVDWLGGIVEDLLRPRGL